MPLYFSELPPDDDPNAGVLFVSGGFLSPDVLSDLETVSLDHRHRQTCVDPPRVTPPLMGHSTSLLNGNPVLCGGQTSDSPSSVTRVCQRYNVESREWSTMKDMLEKRSEHSVVQLDEERFWVAGAKFEMS